jgi:hypothetical protein
MLKIIFLGLMASGLPVAIAMAGSALLFILLSDSTCRPSWSSTAW